MQARVERETSPKTLKFQVEIDDGKYGANILA